MKTCVCCGRSFPDDMELCPACGVNLDDPQESCAVQIEIEVEPEAWSQPISRFGALRKYRRRSGSGKLPRRASPPGFPPI